MKTYNMRLEIKNFRRNKIEFYGKPISIVIFKDIKCINCEPNNFKTFSLYLNNNIKPLKYIDFIRNAMNINGYKFMPNQVEIPKNTGSISIVFESLICVNSMFILLDYDLIENE
jgi:hypothetical protein